MVLAVTSNAEINALAAQMARSAFMVPETCLAREGRAMTASDLLTRLSAEGPVLPLVAYRNGEAEPVHAGLDLAEGDEVLHLVRRV